MAKAPRVHPLIVKSCQLLDAVLESPEWDRLIDLRKFSIYSSIRCTLGQISGNVVPGAPYKRIPWGDYYDGEIFLDQFGEDHPDVLTSIGLKYNEVTAAFQCDVPTYYGRDQSDQWELYLAWRRETRDSEKSKKEGD